MVAVGIAVAYRMYATAPIPRVAPLAVNPLTTAARSDLYGDAFNEEVFMRPGAQLTAALVEFDDAGVDGSVNALAALVSRTSNGLRGLQTGFARNYALSMLAGATLVVATDPGGEAVVNGTVPWLTVLWLVPLAGSAVTILLPPACASSPSGPACSSAVLTLAVAVVTRRRVQARRPAPTSSSKATRGYRPSAPATSSAWTASRSCWCC